MAPGSASWSTSGPTHTRKSSGRSPPPLGCRPVSYTHLRAHETRGNTWGHRSPAATHLPRPAHCPRISPDLESRRPGQFPPNHDTDRFNPTSPFQTLKYYKSKFSKNLNTSPTRHFPEHCPGFLCLEKYKSIVHSLSLILVRSCVLP